MFDRNRWRQRFKKYLFTVFIGMGIAFILIWITLPKTHETVLPPQKRSEEKSPSEKKHVLSEAEGNEEKSPQFIHIIRVAQESRRAGEPESQSTNHQLPVTTRHTTLDTRHSTLNQQSETSETLVLRNQQSVRQSPIALEEASKEDVEAEKHVLSKAEGIEFHERDPILISQGKKLLKKGEFPMLFNQYENHFTTTYAYLMAMKKHAHARLTLITMTDTKAHSIAELSLTANGYQIIENSQKLEGFDLANPWDLSDDLSIAEEIPKWKRQLHVDTLFVAMVLPTSLSATIRGGVSQNIQTEQYQALAGFTTQEDGKLIYQIVQAKKHDGSIVRLEKPIVFYLNELMSK